MPTAARPRSIEYRRLAELIPAKVNPKRHDLVGLRRSIERFGIIDPIVEDGRTCRLIAGHGRLETLAAAELAGIAPPDGVLVTRQGWKVPIVVGWRSRNDAEARAAIVAVNHLTETGGWDLAELHATLNGIDLTGTGYTPPDLDAMLATLNPPVAPDTGTDEPATPRAAPAHTKRGDVWHLGPHRLICGDCRELDTWRTVLEGSAAQLIFTSPPYAEQRVYDQTAGFEPIPPDEYVAWYALVADNASQVLRRDGSYLLNIKEAADDFQRQRYVLDLFAAHIDWGWRYMDQYVWPRPAFPIDPHNARRFKNGWEPVVHYTLEPVFKWHPERVRVDSDKSFTYDPTQQMGGNRETGLLHAARGDKHPGLAYPSNVLPNFGVAATGTEHPAAFPVALPGWFIQVFTDEGDAVLDPFSGAGSTILAAHAHNRVGFGIELSPAYVDQTCARWQDTTGDKPRRNGRAVNFAR